MSRAFLVMLVSWLLTPAMVGAGVRIDGRVIDQSGLALPGVTVRLTALPQGAVQTAVTGGSGEYTFEVEPGQYQIDASLDGFEPASRQLRVDAAATLEDLVLSLGHFSQETTVVAVQPPTEIQPRQFGAPATIAEKVIDNAPLRTNRYDDLLPLLPNVVRGPDGLISVAGARAPQGVVLLNGVPGMDVASGEPVAPVPLAAVESVQVITTGFPAEYARSTGGVTVVNTRAGSDSVKFTVNSFTPRPRLDDGGVRGIEAWEPNMGIRGPIARGRAWFAQSLDYRYERTKFDTRTGEQDRRQRGLTSFSQVDGRVGASHVVSGWFSGQTGRIDGAGLSAFTPLGTVPTSRPQTWGAALVDRATVGDAATLETRFEARRQALSLDPVGASPYVVGHDITRGSYFESLDRHALSLQANTVYSRAWSSGQGGHLFKAGASVVHGTLDGTRTGTPVRYLRSDGTLARVVGFDGAGSFSADAVDVGVFVQDTWTVSNQLVADIGVRADRATRVGGGLAPRLGITWKAGDETTVTGGMGLFADKTPLAALAYPGYQSRVVSRYDTSGALLGTTAYRSVLADSLDRARAWIWNAQVDRRLGSGWQVRMGYQERQGSGELVLTPATGSGGDAIALLTTDGESRARSLETTLGFRPASGRHQLYLSYVRSSARGNTNDFNQLEATFRDPLLEPGVEAPLPVDVPHRLLVWGLFSLPKETTVAPFFEMRSGFPFSAIGEDWTYVGQRNSYRYPMFASLDLIVNKMVTLPGGLRARVGIKLYNVAGRRNGRDVQRDIALSEFGTTYNALGRQVRGIFEIIWNGTRR